MKNKKRKNKFNASNGNQGNKGNKNFNNGKKPNYVDNKNNGYQNGNGNNNNNDRPYVKDENKSSNLDDKNKTFTSKFDEIEEEIEQLELDEEDDLVEEIKNIADEEVSSNFVDDYYRNNNSYQSSNTNIFEENDENIQDNNNTLDEVIEDDILEEKNDAEFLESNIFEETSSIDRTNQTEFYNSYNTIDRNDGSHHEEIMENNSVEGEDTYNNQNNIFSNDTTDIENENIGHFEENNDYQNEVFKDNNSFDGESTIEQSEEKYDNQSDHNDIVLEENNVFEKDEDVFIERENTYKNDDTQNHFNKWYSENIEENNDSAIANNEEKASDNELVENHQDSLEETFENKNNFESMLNGEQQEKLQELFENNESYNYKISNEFSKNGIINRNEANEIIEEYNVDIPKNVSRADEDDASSSNNVTTKIYLSFQARVSILVCCILVLLVSAFVLIIKSATSQEYKKVGYEESTTVEYSACLESSDPYKTKCLDPKEKYNASSIKNMKATFTYKVKFDENVNHSISYYVVLVNKIYDKKDSKNVVYENEDVILDKEVEDINSDSATIDIDVNIDFKEYNDFATNYVKKYSNSSDATLDAILYVTDGEETRKVATLNIPLMKNDFKVSSTLVSKDRYTAEIVLKEWTDKDTRGVIFGIIFVLIAIVLMIRFTKLVMSTITKKSAYEVKLQEILNEYDRMIVIARDGYASETVMKVIKVDSFEKLLDMREMFNKPIIYSKVNNVKSEFIVEDEDTIYKYVMKEADIN